MDLSRLTVVLDKLRHPDNLGSALRAMKNCGLSRLTLSDPTTRDFDRARTLAAGADDLLRGMVVASDLAEAVAHGTLVAGTTSRQLAGRPSLWLSEAVRLLGEETDRGGQAVLVFGNEQRGLSDAELDCCQLVVNIPTAKAKESINLAQAVMLAAHACYLASLAPRSEAAPVEPSASAGLLQALVATMRSTLLEADFLNPQSPEPILSELRRLIERAGPTRREAELLLNAFKHLRRAVRRDRSGPASGH